MSVHEAHQERQRITGRLGIGAAACSLGPKSSDGVLGEATEAQVGEIVVLGSDEQPTRGLPLLDRSEDLARLRAKRC